MTNLLFGFQGRANRAKFWLVALAIFVVEAILFAVLGSNVAMSDDPQEALARMGSKLPALRQTVSSVSCANSSASTACVPFLMR